MVLKFESWKICIVSQNVIGTIGHKDDSRVQYDRTLRCIVNLAMEDI